MTTKTKTKYKFERKGTMPKVGDYVIAEPWEFSGEDYIKAYCVPRKVQRITKYGAVCSAHREKIEYDLGYFEIGRNRVLKRTSN